VKVTAFSEKKLILKLALNTHNTQPFYGSLNPVRDNQGESVPNVHFAIFWIFWSKMKITQADAPTIWMDCHPIQTNWCPYICHPHHFYAGCPSLHNPPNLFWLGTGTKYAGLHTWWLGIKVIEKSGVE